MCRQQQCNNYSGGAVRASFNESLIISYGGLKGGETGGYATYVRHLDPRPGTYLLLRSMYAPEHERTSLLQQ